MTDRVEEIRERVEKATPGRWQVGMGAQVISQTDAKRDDGWAFVADAKEPPDAALIANAPSDIRFLLSEIQRLRKVEEAARETDRMLGGYADDPIFGPTAAACRSSLSNALEQHIPEPVREEMER